MLIGKPNQNLETQRRQALARVYAFLISLAEDKPANAQETGNNTEVTQKKTKETHNKSTKRANVKSPRNQRP